MYAGSERYGHVNDVRMYVDRTGHDAIIPFNLHYFLRPVGRVDASSGSDQYMLSSSSPSAPCPTCDIGLAWFNQHSSPHKQHVTAVRLTTSYSSH